MHIGHGRLCVCLSVPGRIPTLLHGPGVTWGNGRRCPLAVNCWADLQSVHGFRCYDSECLYSLYGRFKLVLALVFTGDRKPA